MRNTVLSAAILASLPAAPLAAQVATIDEGSFTISRNGAAVGREEFSIRRTPAGEGGAVYVASATVSYDGRRLSPALRADAAGSPLAYQVEVRVGSEVQERLTGQVGRGRFSALTKTPRGESAKEYVVSDGALILDDDVFHQYFFVAHSARAGGATVPVVVPRRNAQLSMRIDERGAESVTVGGRALDARHLVLHEGAGGPERDVWVDAQGRVLKVAIASRGVVALRDEPPR
ncbi:MAG TPA: hypothetical protein VFJ74_10890 [Gemmatimonadaceae bacterium]|nr:hypothetical protein [Gemmatimonadaceae bacterium]